MADGEEPLVFEVAGAVPVELWLPPVAELRSDASEEEIELATLETDEPTPPVPVVEPVVDPAAVVDGLLTGPPGTEPEEVAVLVATVLEPPETIHTW